ncbi:MAG: GyrI-like domain-containing protein, partial [Treponema sp.]|nr:GyrI-like domain-containing protein [Treponema sp.]
MSVFEVPATDWAKFRCVGPLPGAIQAVNTEVFKTWLPGNPDYEMSASM